MTHKTLAETNPYLRNKKLAYRLRLRSLASSTAIETGESIEVLEEKIRRIHSRKARVKLA